MKIRIKEDSVYGGRKLIASIVDGEIKFKHYVYKKHREAIEALMENSSPVTAEPAENNPPITADDPMPKTPMHLILEGEGRWYGESNPPAVEWRRANWSKEAFVAKYGKQADHLAEVYEKHNLIYDREYTSS